MKTLAIMSDLHIDLNGFSQVETHILIDLLHKERVDHLHIAGDLSNDHERIGKPFLELLKKECHVSFNLGNHDMLGLTEEQIQALDGQVIELDGASLVHLAGWYDYSFHPEKTPAVHLANKNFYWFDRKLDRSHSDPQLTQQSLDKLEKLLQSTQQAPIVALHFVPHGNFVPTHAYFDRFKAFLGSQTFHDVFLKYGVKDVVFGHLHHHHDTVIDGIRYQARPLGYKREWKLVRDFLTHHPHLYDGPIYDLAKRFRAVKDHEDFKTYTLDHLSDELLQAVTIFRF
ncbi:metallophosphoesterase [Streptococcus cameli]